ncbi:MAG: sulfatase-like hydrolase/transferase [Chloroflexota bacterium]
MTRSFSRRDFLKLASLAAANVFLAGGLAARASEASRPNILIFVFDTLSARHMSLYGYHRKTTPNLERFAERANVYHRHYSAGNFTVPGTASLLTGTYPWTHRAFQQSGLIQRSLASHNLFAAASRPYRKTVFSQNLWAENLLSQFQADIDTHLPPTAFSQFDGLAGDSALFHRDKDVAFRAYDDFLFQKFDTPGSLYFSLLNKINSTVMYNDTFAEHAADYPLGIPNLLKYDVYYLLEDIFSGIQNQLTRLDAPALGYFHFFSPHELYYPRKEFAGRFNDGWTPEAKPFHPLSDTAFQHDVLCAYRNGYDELIANVDDEFGKLMDFMQRAGFFENSYIVVTSDHGQLFERGEHGHGTALMFDPVIHIPLLVHAPGQTGRNDFFAPNSNVDILPTLLRCAGFEIPAWAEGVPLAGLGGSEDLARPVFAIDAKSNPALTPLRQATIAMIQGDQKLIHYRGYPGAEDSFELYNLRDDPEEMRDLAADLPDVVASMKNVMLARLAEADQPFTREG